MDFGFALASIFFLLPFTPCCQLHASAAHMDRSPGSAQAVAKDPGHKSTVLSCTMRVLVDCSCLRPLTNHAGSSNHLPEHRRFRVRNTGVDLEWCASAYALAPDQALWTVCQVRSFVHSRGIFLSSSEIIDILVAAWPNVVLAQLLKRKTYLNLDSFHPQRTGKCFA